ncbi:HlyC/CorC family transporter [Bacillus sp. ISL-40]|uniref:hemolysin family protein n=1 Tax=unclassified Bacillus (in: firmicutes) TaxID=185979 RepID=UPI001BE50EEA|nr:MULTISPECIES: hemolysin family protein [unclassified Bacillus (in: firmicutes)]MBT2698999.1 HlyC/CorC family transporter [Bacillus sp. ISL-40]MBT2723671.1 HlyC/CorC family transporter [Bacillus sp. ISL-46]MBT2739498.1 HlyC/CorC family transporter [Bacillus sp. ISL-77]
MMIINLLLITLLIALTGFFVAIEFAIVKVRPSRIDQLIAEGKKGAVAAKKVVSHLDEYLSTCQLGITVTALGLGWLGEPTVEKLLHPLLTVLNLNESVTHILSFGLAFASVTFLHVVIGELAPKTVAIQKAEIVTLYFSRPIIWFNKIMFPFIWLLNGSARLLAGLFGLNPASEQESAHSEEELRILLLESYKSGEINQNELRYVNNIFEFDERLAKEIMVPRTEISSLTLDDTINEVIKRVKSENYTRYPVMDGDIDNIIGIINVKALLTAKIMNKGNKEELKVKSYINPVIYVIETIPIHDLLVKMQKERTHMAILMDEYGGTSGLVTVEDIIEEIVGEVRDEFDADEVAEIQKIKENHYLVDAKLLIEDVNDLLGTSLATAGIITIGGWFLSQNLDSQKGSEVVTEGYLFKVHTISGYHISNLEVKKI